MNCRCSQKKGRKRRRLVIAFADGKTAKKVGISDEGMKVSFKAVFAAGKRRTTWLLVLVFFVHGLHLLIHSPLSFSDLVVPFVVRFFVLD